MPREVEKSIYTDLQSDGTDFPSGIPKSGDLNYKVIRCPRDGETIVFDQNRAPRCDKCGWYAQCLGCHHSMHPAKKCEVVVDLGTGTECGCDKCPDRYTEMVYGRYRIAMG